MEPLCLPDHAPEKRGKGDEIDVVSDKQRELACDRCENIRILCAAQPLIHRICSRRSAGTPRLRMPPLRRAGVSAPTANPSEEGSRTSEIVTQPGPVRDRGPAPRARAGAWQLGLGPRDEHARIHPNDAPIDAHGDRAGERPAHRRAGACEAHDSGRAWTSRSGDPRRWRGDPGRRQAQGGAAGQRRAARSWSRAF